MLMNIEKNSSNEQVEEFVLIYNQGTECEFTQHYICKVIRKDGFERVKYITHRLDGPAKEWKNGGKEWWVNGNLHREDGPAIEYAGGGKEWLINGHHHREDGPAIEFPEACIFYLNGINYTKEEYWSKIKFGGFV